MKYSTLNYAEALYSLCKEKPDSFAKEYAKFLIQNNLLKLLPKIERNFLKIVEKKEGKKTILIEGADKTTIDNIISQIDKNNFIETKVDSSLVKGVRITIGEDRFDNSVKRRLTDWHISD